MHIIHIHVEEVVLLHFGEHECRFVYDILQHAAITAVKIIKMEKDGAETKLDMHFNFLKRLLITM